MRAVLMKSTGEADVLYLGDTPTPQPGPKELLVRVHASALNRADLVQRRGGYPPPPGASEILGLEAAGEIVGMGSAVTGWQTGNRICSLLAGGGYAEYAVIPDDMAMPIPDSLTYEQAAAIPEVFLTAYLNLFWLGGLSGGKTVLVHAGASGVGTAAIQLIREAGGDVYVTAGSSEKLARCHELGAKAGWNYHDGLFADWVHQQTGGRGVDIILDFVGAPYFQANLDSLSMDGRLVIIGTLGGSTVAEVDIGKLRAKRQHVIGTALRSRSVQDKARLSRDLMAFAWDKVASGQIAPVVDSVFDWADVVAAHQRMEANLNIGKIVLRVTH